MWEKSQWLSFGCCFLIQRSESLQWESLLQSLQMKELCLLAGKLSTKCLIMIYAWCFLEISCIYMQICTDVCIFIWCQGQRDNLQMTLIYFWYQCNMYYIRWIYNESLTIHRASACTTYSLANCIEYYVNKLSDS